MQPKWLFGKTMSDVEWPIFVFVEDGSLQICDSLETARRDYEGVDVESLVYQFFDYSGAPLEPRFTVPNRSGSILGLFKWCSSGEFVFDPSTDLGRDPVDVALHETSDLLPNPFFTDLDAVCAHLEKRGNDMSRYRAKTTTKPNNAVQ